MPASGMSNNNISIPFKSSLVGAKFLLYKLMICKLVIGSTASLIINPSAPFVLMPCSGENNSTILNPASIKAFLLDMPLIVVAASLVKKAILLVFHFGFKASKLSIPN